MSHLEVVFRALKKESNFPAQQTSGQTMEHRGPQGGTETRD